MNREAEIITAAQLRAARGLLDFSQTDVAVAANCGRSAVADYERNARLPHTRTLIDIRNALEAAGVGFIFENGKGVGVRLK